jgi:hypothetical protein
LDISKINDLAEGFAKNLVDHMKNPSFQSYILNLDEDGQIIGCDEEAVLKHSGIYGFSIQKMQQIAVVYIGKIENKESYRLVQHLSRKNKDGSLLKDSVKTKTSNIKQALRDGFVVRLHLYANEFFEKPSLSCIELAASIYAKNDCQKVFPKIKHWNQRIG